MDFLLLSNIAVAIGTMLLAYFSYQNIKSSKDQLLVLQNQIKLQFSQQEPELHVNELGFKGNKLELIISNLGNGNAYDVCVNSSFSNMDLILTEESKALMKANPPDKWNELDLRGHYCLNVSKKIFQKRDDDRIKAIIANRWQFLNRFNTLRPRECDVLVKGSACTFLINAELEEPLMQGKVNNKFFECEPFFLLRCETNFLSEVFGIDSYWQGYTFNDLKELLTQNDIRYISVIFSLDSKDKIQNTISHQNITSFIIDFKSDNNLEEAYNKKRKTNIYPLDRLELQKQIGFMEADTYYGSKWGRRE